SRRRAAARGTGRPRLPHRRASLLLSPHRRRQAYARMKVAVVGLGIAGLSVCARLAEAGHDVFGFDQFQPMHDRGSSHGDTRIFRRTPGEGEIYVPLAERAREGWLDWEEQFGAPLLEPRPGIMTGPPGSAFVKSCEDLSVRHGHAFAMRD